MGSNAALGQQRGALTVNSGGLLDLNGYSASVGAFNGAGTVNNVAGVGTSVLTFGNGNANGSFSGTIQNTSASGVGGPGQDRQRNAGSQRRQHLYRRHDALRRRAELLGLGSARGARQHHLQRRHAAICRPATLRTCRRASRPLPQDQAASIDTNGNSVTFGSTLSGSGRADQAGRRSAAASGFECLPWNDHGRRRHPAAWQRATPCPSAAR